MGKGNYGRRRYTYVNLKDVMGLATYSLAETQDRTVDQQIERIELTLGKRFEDFVGTEVSVLFDEPRCDGIGPVSCSTDAILTV